MTRKPLWHKAALVLALTVMLVLGTGMALPAAAYAAPNKQDIVRVDFVHYAKQGQASKKPSLGYDLMGVKWNAAPVAYSINTASIPAYLDAATVAAGLAQSSETWDAATAATELFASPGSTTAAYGKLDGINAVAFGSYSGSSNVIAVTSIWFNRKTKSIVEFDMLFNTYYTWGDADTAVADVMDLQNIATHEFGHAVGLNDIYAGTYAYVTMYGYADFNQTDKRDLDMQDITGLQILYGN